MGTQEPLEMRPVFTRCIHYKKTTYLSRKEGNSEWHRTKNTFGEKTYKKFIR